MADFLLRPRTASELVDAAFALYRRNSLQYIMVAALANIPALVLQLLMPDASRLSPSQNFLPMAVVSTASLITYSIVSAVVVRLGSQVYLGEDPDVARTISDVVPRIPILLLAGFCKGILYIVGALFFFVGSLYVMARYFAVSTVIVLEGKGPMEAFARSSELSNERKRHVLSTLALVGIIYFVLSFGVTTIAQLISKSEVFQIMVVTIFSIVANPLLALTGMMLYYDARIRAEGFDVEHMAAALDDRHTAVAAGRATV